MNNLNELFHHMADTVIITDAYGYVLDFNRNDMMPSLKKGVRLSKLMLDAFTKNEGKLETENGYFYRITTPVKEGKKLIGYTILLTDITEEEKLARQSQEKSQELRELTRARQKANQKLSEYALEVKNLSEYAEQLRIARSIHDDSGHAITEIHTISQMCLKLMDTEPKEYQELISEGIKICKKAGKGIDASEYDSLVELLEIFKRRNSFPIDIQITGTEADFIKEKYPVIERILKEAYHNTLEHSLAESMRVSATLGEEDFTLKIQDNGSFRGEFEPGFGLNAMKDYVNSSDGKISFIAEEGQGFGIVVKWRKNDER